MDEFTSNKMKTSEFYIVFFFSYVEHMSVQDKFLNVSF